MVMNLITQAILLVSLLAFTVSVITEVLKAPLKIVDRNSALSVIILSLVLTPITVIAYCQYQSYEMTWYMYVGSVVGGFMVAFISMFGWEKIQELYNKYVK